MVPIQDADPVKTRFFGHLSYPKAWSGDYEICRSSISEDRAQVSQGREMPLSFVSMNV